MDKGYIKLWRKLQDNPIWRIKKEKFSKGQAWIDLLLRANHKDAIVRIGNREILVKAGSFITSQRKLASFWNWSVGYVSKFLRNLEYQKMIKKKA